MTETVINDITIRKFDPDRDAPAVGAIVSEIWIGGDDALMEQQFGIIAGKPWGEWMSQSVLGYLKADGARSFVAEKQGDIVGFCSYVIDQQRSRGTVGYNGVALRCQGQGIGSAMLDFVLKRIKNEGMEYCAVIVAENEQHAPARHNYQKHGFRPLMGLQYMVQKF